MKIKVTLKDPDGFYDSVEDEVRRHVNKLECLDEDEKEEIIEIRKEKVMKALSKFVEYGEYISIEFDIDSGTATVLKKE